MSKFDEVKKCIQEIKDFTDKNKDDIETLWNAGMKLLEVVNLKAKKEVKDLDQILPDDPIAQRSFKEAAQVVPEIGSSKIAFESVGKFVGLLIKLGKGIGSSKL